MESSARNAAATDAQRRRDGTGADRYGIGIHTALSLIARGAIRATNVGLGARPRWRITPDAIADFERMRAAGKAAKTPRRRQAAKDDGVIEFFS